MYCSSSQSLVQTQTCPNQRDVRSFQSKESLWEWSVTGPQPYRPPSPVGGPLRERAPPSLLLTSQADRSIRWPTVRWRWTQHMLDICFLSFPIIIFLVTKFNRGLRVFTEITPSVWQGSCGVAVWSWRTPSWTSWELRTSKSSNLETEWDAQHGNTKNIETCSR